MKKIKQKLHSCMATLIMCSMIQTSYAVEASPWANAGSAIMQTMQQYVTQRGQGINQQIQQSAMARQQQMMSSMKPQVGPAQFFPECPVLQRITNMPENACEASSINPADVGQMLGIQSMAKMAAKEYEKSTLGSLECIANRQKTFDSQLIDFQNSLKRMQDQLKQDSQVFRDNTNKLMADMKSNWADLNGAGTSVDAKTGDFTKQFSPTCATFLRGNKIDNKGGLLGMMDSTKDANILSANYSQARPQIEAGIINDGNQLSAAIKKGGLDAVDLNNVSADNKVAIEAIIKTESEAYQKTVGRLSKDINFDPAFNVGSLDGTYSSGAEANINNSLANFKNSKMRDCMAGKTGASLNDGIKIDSSTINSLITQAGTDGGTAATGYRNAVMEIMNNSDLNVTLEMKLNQIQALERTYKNMVFNSNIGGQNRSEPATQAFKRLASDCETFYAQPSANGGMSPQQLAQKAQSAMRELKNAHDALGDKIAQSISAKLINCSGNQSNGTRACTPDMITPNAPGFCMATANKCANEIQGCYGEISAKVGMKTAQIKNLGLQYNAAANQMLARANQLFTQQKAAVSNLLSNIKTKYPGMNFVIGGGASGAGGADDPLFIANPPLARAPNDFGIDLVAGGDMEKYLQDLPKKLESLQNIIADQQVKAKEQVDAYINGASPIKGLKEYLEESKGKWEELADQCKSKVDESYRAIDTANKEKQKQDNKNAEFCKKYNAFVNSESPTCGGAEKLTSNISDIVNSIPGQATSLAYEAEQACASSNNEAVVGSDGIDSTKINFDKFCSEGKASDSSLLKEINKRYSAKIEKEQLLQAAEDMDLTKSDSPAEGKSPLEVAEAAFTTAETAFNTAENAAKSAKIEKESKDNAKKLAKSEFDSTPAAPADKKREAEEKLNRATTEFQKAELALESADREKASKESEKLKAKTAKDNAADPSKKPETKVTKSDPICKKIGSLPNLDAKREKLAAFIEKAIEAAGASSTSGSSAKLTRIVGQMANSPCGAIASSTGKGSLLPWERPPEAGIGTLGSSK